MQSIVLALSLSLLLTLHCSLASLFGFGSTPAKPPPVESGVTGRPLQRRTSPPPKRKRVFDVHKERMREYLLIPIPYVRLLLTPM